MVFESIFFFWKLLELLLVLHRPDGDIAFFGCVRVGVAALG